MTFKIKSNATPVKKPEIVAAARDVLEACKTLHMFAPDKKEGAPQFFGLYKRTLHVVKIIGAEGFQPFERHNDRTLAFAIAILVTDKKGPSKAETKWLDWATERGVLCHVVKTWGEFTHAVSELGDV